MAQEPPSKNFCRKRGVSIFGCKAVFSKAPLSFALEGGLFIRFILADHHCPTERQSEVDNWLNNNKSPIKRDGQDCPQFPPLHTFPFTIVRSWVAPQLASLQDRPAPAPPWAPDFHSVAQDGWDADLQRRQLLVMALLAEMMAEMVVPQVCRSPSGILWAPTIEGNYTKMT